MLTAAEIPKGGQNDLPGYADEPGHEQDEVKRDESKI